MVTDTPPVLMPLPGLMLVTVAGPTPNPANRLTTVIS